MLLALTLAAAICLLGGLVAASSASAFTGESSVISGGDLTAPAKTIIENPTFLPENVGEAAGAGVAEETAAAGVFESAGVLPVLGPALLSFGAGVGVGSEICHVIGISGCWDFSSTGENVSVTGTATKTFFESGCSSTSPPAPDFSWYAAHESAHCELSFFNIAGNHETCGFSAPFKGGTFAVNPSWSPATCGAGPEAGEYSYSRGAYYIYGFQNRTLGYNVTDDPSTPNYEPGGKHYEAPAAWSKNLASKLAGQSGDPAARVGEKIASKISGSGVADPYALEIPDCDGLKRSGCVALIEELDLKPSVTELDWEDAVIEELDHLEPEKTREEESERVIELEPPPGDKVSPGTEITIVTNPSKEEMPEFLPQPDKTGGEDGEGEDEDEYKKRLVPIFLPGVDELSDATLDPGVGPGRVSHTVPGPGHRFDPATEHDVEVAVNPATAPLVGAGGAGGCEASVGAIDWTPLNQPLGSRFPFGVFAFFVAWIGEWTSSEEAPEWEVTVLPPMLGGEGLQITIDLASMAPVAEVVRVAFIFVSFVGLLWFLGTAAMKIQGDSS